MNEKFDWRRRRIQSIVIIEENADKYEEMKNELSIN